MADGNSETQGRAARTAAEARAERRAAELRENLKRRKAQARGRSQAEKQDVAQDGIAPRAVDWSPVPNAD